jgi:hypothetical protein
MIPGIHAGLDKFANSIGEARIWGGVHFPSDHRFGQSVGQAVATLMIGKFNHSLVDPEPSAFVCPTDKRLVTTLSACFESFQDKFLLSLTTELLRGIGRLTDRFRITSGSIELETFRAKLVNFNGSVQKFGTARGFIGRTSRARSSQNCCFLTIPNSLNVPKGYELA